MLAFTVEPLQTEKGSPKMPIPRPNNDEPGIVGVSAFKNCEKSEQKQKQSWSSFSIKRQVLFSAEIKSSINHPGEDEQS